MNDVNHLSGSSTLCLLIIAEKTSLKADIFTIRQLLLQLALYPSVFAVL